MNTKKTVQSIFAAGIVTFALFGVEGAKAMPSPPPPQMYGQEPWENPPKEWQEVEKKGFHDGIAGARRDFENHRPPNVENRDEYRHPPVSRVDREDYRQSFRRGYEAGVEHIMHGGPHPY